jgi:hypothetical protein
MDQDWSTVTLTKSTKQKNAGLSTAQAISRGKMTGAVSTERKYGAGENKSAHNGSSVGG